MAGLDVNRGKHQVLRNTNINPSAQQIQRNGRGQNFTQVSSPLILDGRKYIEISDPRGYTRSSPVSSQSILSQQDLNRAPATLTSGLRGYNPGPQPGMIGQVQTLPRNQGSPVAPEYNNQTLPSRYSQTMQQQNRIQAVPRNGRGASYHNLSQQNINQQILQQKVAQQQQQMLNQNQLLSQQNIMQQKLIKQQQQQQNVQPMVFQKPQSVSKQQQLVSEQQFQSAMQQQKLPDQHGQQHQQAVQQQAVQQQAVQQLMNRQRMQETEQWKRQAREQDVQKKMAGLGLADRQVDQERTYMNVQPVAIAGKGGKILRPGEIKENMKQEAGGRKIPAVPKSQEVKHKKEPLYSTILQCPDQANKALSGGMYEDCVYANYAPASLYSSYSNYSELEVLRSTDSQGSNEDEPTEGLPNLGGSPVSSSYSELRQAHILGGVQPAVPVTHTGDGSIYEPVLPPKGIPGPNSIHFKSLSGGSTDSDYFGSCVECGGKIIGEGSGCSAMGRLYHIQCFKCTECGRQLQGLPFYAVEGSPLCEADYTNTLEKCCKCFQPILERILRATGKPYHPNCFTCVACNKSLDGIPFTVDATNQIHCIEDFHRRFAPRCSVCQEPIMPTPGQEETVRVVALDRSFHLQCYRCVDCNLLLSSEEEGRGCYPLDNTVLCRQCNTRRIQALTSTIASD